TGWVDTPLPRTMFWISRWIIFLTGPMRWPRGPMVCGPGNRERCSSHGLTNFEMERAGRTFSCSPGRSGIAVVSPHLVHGPLDRAEVDLYYRAIGKTLANIQASCPEKKILVEQKHASGLPSLPDQWVIQGFFVYSLFGSEFSSGPLDGANPGGLAWRFHGI